MTREAHEHDPPASGEPSIEEAEQALASTLGDELKHLVEIVHFGHDVEEFMSKSPVGRALVARMEADLNEAIRQLLDLDSLRGKKARVIFDKAKTAVTALRYLNESITAGLDAERMIQAHDQADDVGSR